MRFFILTLVVLLFSGCSKKEEQEPIKIAVSSWVGYMPLFYASEKGKLKNLNIEVIPTTSLSASLEFMKRDIVDAFCATQMEYELLKDKVTPIILLDESFGGDKVLSNISKDKLYEMKDSAIDVYMEMDSVNELVFKHFKKMKKWENIEFNIKNHTQNFIVNADLKEDSLVVTYEPYATLLQKKGFHIIETSKHENLFIFDAVFVNKNSIKRYSNEFKKLKKELDIAILALKNNPEEFYKVVKPFLESTSYEEFLATLEDIKWINNNPTFILKKIEEENISTKDIM